MSAALFVAAPLALILAVQVWRYADRTPNVVVLHAWLARIGCLATLSVAGTNIWLGVAGVRRAKSERVPAILPWAALFFGIVTMLVWIIATIGVLNTTESLVRFVM